MLSNNSNRPLQRLATAALVLTINLCLHPFSMMTSIWTLNFLSVAHAARLRTPLIDHGGLVLANPRVRLVFWGSNWNNLAFASDVIPGLESLYRGLNGSAVLGITNQYLRGAKATVSLDPNTVVDLSSSASALSGPDYSRAGVVAKLCEIVGKNPSNPSNYYDVYIDGNDNGKGSLCAVHSYFYDECPTAAVKIFYGFHLWHTKSFCASVGYE